MSAVQSLPDLPDLPEHDDSLPAGYELMLDIRDSVARLTITGCLDESAADAIEGIICAGGPVNRPVEVVAAGITAADPLALVMIVAAVRERLQRGWPHVVVVALSDSLAAAARNLGLPSEAPFSLADG